MATRDRIVADFARAVGSRVAHVTAAENLPFIKAHGLLSAHDLASAMNHPSGTLPLRDTRLLLEAGTRRAVLNHQKPIRHGRRAAERVLDGHGAESWAAALDRRVFLWPERKGARFARSIARDRDISVIWMRSDALADALFDMIDLAPINTGNFTQGGAHARRGDWIYVPLAKGLDAFRENRRRRLGARGRDAVVEISLRQGLGADLLDDLICGEHA